MTNADRIRSMMDDELAELLTRVQGGVFKEFVTRLCHVFDDPTLCEQAMEELKREWADITEANIEWLQQEVEDG